jgi:RNA polymerase sigma-70 factor, ECF subfamily
MMRPGSKGEPVGADADLVPALFAASYRCLVGQLYGVCGDLTEAEEVVQEAFARAVQHERAFARVGNHEAWLRTVAVNVARTRWRRRSLGRRPENRPDPRAVELSDDRLQLVVALRRLPAAQREAIALHYLADLPVHEVAATVGASVGTVKSRLSRGRTALAVLLRDEDHDPATAAEVRHA